MIAFGTAWAETSLPDRIGILKRLRRQMAGETHAFVQAISHDLSRNPAESMAAEILPLLAAIRFLEREAASILAPRKLSRRGLPFWLRGVHSEVHRVPFGRILVIGPSNYPLFLPGVQCLQALVAGNTVVWKPGRNGRPVADLFAQAIYTAGLPTAALRITDESVAAAEQELSTGVDKVFLTGSVAAGVALQQRLAQTLTPSVVELSGSDAVVVLPSADLSRAAQALAFGIRLNGAATCMSPRRILLVGATEDRKTRFLTLLKDNLRGVAPAQLTEPVLAQLRSLLDDAQAQGAEVHSGASAGLPMLILNGKASMAIAQTDIFAPVLTLIEVQDTNDLLAAQRACPFGLTASIFGDEKEARRMANRLEVGSVFINDLIVPSADPRVPFGGRRQSGFGTTRGAEGLLEMTAIQVIARQRNRTTQQYQPTGAKHARLFDGVIRLSYAGSWRERIRAVRDLVQAGRSLRDPAHTPSQSSQPLSRE